MKKCSFVMAFLILQLLIFSNSFAAEKIFFDNEVGTALYDIWMVNPDGTELVQLTDDAQYGVMNANPKLSPDGKTLYFTKDYNIVKMDLNTGQVTPVTVDGAYLSYGYNSFDISPDGTKIVYQYGYRQRGLCWTCTTLEIWEMDINGENKVRLTNNNYRDTQPIYSPDGLNVLITHYQYAPSSDCCNMTDLYIYDLTTNNEIKLYGSSNYDWGGDWTESGIIFSTKSPNYKIALISPDGSNFNLLPCPADECASPVFSSNNSKIMYVQRTATSGDIFKMNVNGTENEKITDGMKVINISVGFVSTDLDDDGILDEDDSCPDEDATGFDADSDGCIDNFGGLNSVINTLLSDNIIDQNLADPLITKVTNAETKASKDNICAAVNQLRALQNQIEAKRGNPLSNDVADQLIQYAENIISQNLSNLQEGENCN